MEKSWIKNFTELAITENRKTALLIAGAGFDAINTEQVIYRNIKLENNLLKICDKVFDLEKFKKIKVVGFGKASCDAALALEGILKEKITEGFVIGLEKITCDIIQTFVGTHPKPSMANVDAGDKIFKAIDGSSEDDLIIVLVSGGGSALLCYGENECEQGIKLYDKSLTSGKTIKEINTVRKHISFLKGGGLAKVAYPATVVGLIFSDVPGDNFENVASGPTYKDETTIDDAQKIILENNLGDFNLIETPKEDKYFEKVHNFVLVSNKTAVEAMAKKTEELGLNPVVISTDLYDEVEYSLRKIFDKNKLLSGSVLLAAGEPKIKVEDNGRVKGKGGRNLHMGLSVIGMDLIDDESVFISFASDGMDNSDMAGAVVDKNTKEKAQKMNLSVADYLERFDSYNFFQKTGDMINTGPTGANVSDLMILVNKK